MHSGLNRFVLCLLLSTAVHGHVADSCASAQRAPLRISPPFKPELNALRMVYSKAQNFTVRNAGNRLALEATNGKGLGFVDYRGKQYTAELADFRSPAEHVLGTTRPPVELQVYHHDEDGKTLAISLLFKIGTARSLLIDKVLRSFRHRHGKRGGSPVAVLDLAQLFKHSSDYFAYSTENCGPEPWGHPTMDRWVVLSKMKQVSALQLQQLRKVVPELAKTTRSLHVRQATTELVSTKAKAMQGGQKQTSVQTQTVDTMAAHTSGMIAAPPVADPQKAPAILQKAKLPKEVEMLQPPVSNEKTELPWVSTDLPPLRANPPSGGAKLLATQSQPMPQAVVPSFSQISPGTPASPASPAADAIPPTGALKSPEELMAMLRIPSAPTSASKVPQFSPDELNMVNVMEGAPDDVMVVPTSMPATQVGKVSKRPAAGLLQAGSGDMAMAEVSQEPLYTDPNVQAALGGASGASPTYVPPPPFYNSIPTASPETGSYSRPQQSLMLTDADLTRMYKQGFNQYVAKQPEKDRLISMYNMNAPLPPIDPSLNTMGPADIMPNLPNLPAEPPGMPAMPMSMMDGMPNAAPIPPGSPGFSFIQQQNPDDGIAAKLRKIDEALKKHSGSQTPLHPKLTLIQGADANLGGGANFGHGTLTGSSADLLQQQQAYKDWFQQNAQYQKQYGSNFNTGTDVAASLKSRMELVATIQEQQKAMNDEIENAMHRPPPHKNKVASMLRVNSTLVKNVGNSKADNAAHQRYLARVAEREDEMWSEYHHLEQEQKELEQDQRNYEKVHLKTQEEMGLYSARTRQTNTLWQNMPIQNQGPAGFFLAPR